jgi:hypothetical protein
MDSRSERFFVMAHQLPGLWQELLQSHLRPSDLTTWHVLQLHVVLNLGAVTLSPDHLAGLYGVSGSQMAHSIGRLKRALLVATWRDPRTSQKMLLLNPWVASMGNAQRRGWIWVRFCEATDGRAPAVFTEEALTRWAAPDDSPGENLDEMSAPM